MRHLVFRLFTRLLVLALAFTMIGAVVTGLAEARVRHSIIHGKSILLCARHPVRVTTMDRATIVIRKRVHKGFGFRAARITASGSRCISIVLPHRIGWLRWLAQDISSRGLFGLGEAVPSPKQSLLPGAFVRYPHQHVNKYNSGLPVVRILVGRSGILRWTAKIKHLNGGVYVRVGLKQPAAKRICQFTSHNINAYAPIILDKRVVSDPKIIKGICGHSLLFGFPRSNSLDRPLGPREVAADIRPGLLPVTLMISSLK